APHPRPGDRAPRGGGGDPRLRRARALPPCAGRRPAVRHPEADRLRARARARTEAAAARRALGRPQPRRARGPGALHPAHQARARARHDLDRARHADGGRSRRPRGGAELRAPAGPGRARAGARGSGGDRGLSRPRRARRRLSAPATGADRRRPRSKAMGRPWHDHGGDEGVAVPRPGETETVQAGGRAVAISNPRKRLFPRAGYTKLDLVRYYLAVAEGALRAAGGRPSMLVRYPDGIDGEFFYQKRAPRARPDWIDVVELRFPSGRAAEEVVPRDPAALVWLANLACLELHPNPVRADDLEHPDELRVDLD